MEESRFAIELLDLRRSSVHIKLFANSRIRKRIKAQERYWRLSKDARIALCTEKTKKKLTRHHREKGGLFKACKCMRTRQRKAFQKSELIPNKAMMMEVLDIITPIILFRPRPDDITFSVLLEAFNPLLCAGAVCNERPTQEAVWTMLIALPFLRKGWIEEAKSWCSKALSIICGGDQCIAHMDEKGFVTFPKHFHHSRDVFYFRQAYSHFLYAVGDWEKAESICAQLLEQEDIKGLTAGPMGSHDSLMMGEIHWMQGRRNEHLSTLQLAYDILSGVEFAASRVRALSAEIASILEENSASTAKDWYDLSKKPAPGRAVSTVEE